MPSQKIAQNANKKGKTRKKGEAIKKLAEFIIGDPGISVSQLAGKIGVTASNIRTALKKLKEKPNEYAALLGIDGNSMAEAFAVRDDIIKAQKRSRKNKIKRHRPPKERKSARKLIWRGKANWPASITATKKSLTTSELIKACAQHYTFCPDSRKYEGDHDVLNSGCPGLPKTITLKQTQNVL
ncbi:winged helix-turn-helix domain-containing protein [Desulfallas thermosapovorans]|uniref:Winged helix-turn-helix DNA-binding protein n=1 Tax=Desulfallas thermosapovorans DSM 6562 TaxID=1121431 RepID=A0A5S4ZPP6_9FIRM|nr:winged helix-turn-helix domain-containing protein [Desulfallas thermosapovorans]TYO94530.1 winged helix-turn-helix DNA-binding protein [Desulfallas thermosapovorans DSM 6562]